MAYTKSDLVGKRFGKLTVVDLVQNEGEKRKRALCRCDCGTVKNVAISSLRSGDTTSCGCIWKEAIKKSNSTHGKTGTKLHNAWRAMKARCNIRSCSNFEYYGGRGIRVCEEWNRSYATFQEWAINNGYSEGLSIDRIDPNGNYEPSNCRWEDKEVQARNRRTRRTSKTGVAGVSIRLDHANTSYRVSIRANGKNINIGSFGDLYSAVEARKQAELSYWGFTLLE